MGRTGGIVASGRIACLMALMVPPLVSPAYAVTQNGSFQVSAFVIASCALRATPALAVPGAARVIACQQAPMMSPILAPPPRVILHRDESQSDVLIMEF
jgi:hypothetical protein